MDGEVMKVALTGHRSQRLGLDSAITDGEWDTLRIWISSTLKNINVTDYYCGMAEGSDMLGALSVLDLKQQGYNINLHCILPCENYQSNHPFYELIRGHADEWIVLSQSFYRGCDNIRDQYMVDHCDVLLAIFDGKKQGGVYSTIRKAEKAGKNIIYCPEILLRRDNKNNWSTR